ncbi:hypothetical protein ACH4MG_27330 [Streptomyces sp. NPDC017454]|uniref:hypothetical protein n=1 Tax=Streptomyces sp. NPDC017454 TaxID=3364997 RepID=UPI0037B91303
MNTITAEQIENLYTNGGQLELPNGDTLTREELTQYIASCDIDTDDAGTPLDTQWQILADVLGAPDPTNTSELVDVTATTNALQNAASTTYVAQIIDHHDALTIVVRDLTAETAIDNDPTISLDMTPHATFGDLGIYPNGLNNPSVKTAALNWLASNDWETIADRDRIIAGYSDSLWRVGEPLPVRPAADDLSRVAVAASRIGQAEEARDEAIRKALAAGHSVIAIANAANLSRARIYQIRDGRR